jgi:hypothetical protein
MAVRKKTLLVLILCVSTLTCVNGMNLIFGIKTGITCPFYLGDDYNAFLENLEADYDSNPYGDDFTVGNTVNTGFSGGVYIRLAIIKFFAIQSEALFTIAGGAYGWDATSHYYGGTTREYFKMVEIPVLVMLTIPAKKSAVIFYAGASLGLRLLDVKVNTRENREVTERSTYSDEYKKLLFNVIFGMGFDRNMGERFVLSLDARFSLGLLPVLDEDKWTIDVKKWKENIVTVYLGLGILLGKKE